MLDSAIYWGFAILSIGAALGAILGRSVITSALCLIVVFMSIAGFYLLNNADFLAIAQIIIYAVGLTILMLFAVMFTGDKTQFSNKDVNKATRVGYGIVLAYVFALLLRGAVIGLPVQNATGMNTDMLHTLQTEGSTGQLGVLLFTDYALPFEVASILLLAAMIGAIVIAKKRFVEPDQKTLGDMTFPVDLASRPTEEVIEELRARRLSIVAGGKDAVLVGAASENSSVAVAQPVTETQTDA